MRSGRRAVGHPIDVATGTFFTRPVDVSLAGVIPIVLRRTYTTELVVPRSFALPRPFGVGWTCEWNLGLRRTLEGFVLTDDMGSEVPLPEFPSGALVSRGRLAIAGLGIELEQRTDGSIGLTRYGVDRELLTLVFAPIGSGTRWFLSAIEHTPKARIELRRDAKGRVVRLEQTRERSAMELAYDGRGRIVQAQMVFADRSKMTVARYDYDASDHLVRVHDPVGLRHNYTYDANGRMVEERHRRGSIYEMRYDRSGRCHQVSGAGGYQARTLTWDDNARTTTVADSHQAETVYSYDATGQITGFRSAVGEEEQFRYDAEGRLVESVRPDGAVYGVEYDDLGRIARVMRPDGTAKVFTHDDLHRATTYTDPAGVSYTFEHDQNHAIAKVTASYGEVWTYVRNAFGELVDVFNPAGHAMHTQYDGIGNVIVQTDWNGNPRSAKYDARGQRTAMINRLGHETKLGYDGLGRLVKLEFPDGRSWSRRFSPDGREILFIDSAGHRTIERYTECMQLVEIVDEDGYRIQYAWDTEPGRILAVVNSRGERYSFEHDADGNVTRRETFDGAVYEHTWQHGRLVGTIDPEGRHTAFSHDGFGRLIERTTDDHVVRYHYGPHNRPVRIEHPDHVLQFEYDARGLVVAEDQGGTLIHRTFDVMRNQVELRTQHTPSLQATCDPNGEFVELRRNDLRVTIQRDAEGQEVQREIAGAGVYLQSYDSVGRVLTQAFWAPGGDGRSHAATPVVTRQYVFDKSGAVERIHDSHRGVTTLWRDGRGNLVGVVRDPGESDFHGWDGEGNRTFSCRSDRGREILDKARASGFEKLFEIALRHGATQTSIQYDPGNRLRRLSEPDRVIEYDYDACGRVVRKRIKSSTDERVLVLRHNQDGRLCEVVNQHGERWQYRYDGIGRRLSKVAPDGTETRYLWDRYRVIAEIREGRTVTEWIHPPGEGGPPLLLDDGALHVVLADHVGRVSELLSAAGVLEHHIDRGTWGEGFTGGEGVPPFLGQWHDTETGLFYNVFRYYDPDAGRYLRPDPIDLLSGLNAYRFVPSPFDEVDPWGLAGMKYAQLRRRSPTDAIRDSVQTGTGTQTCPVLGTSHNRLDADHIVPLHTITQMEGFDDLPDADKIAIANLEDNFVGVGKNANSSRQNKSWEAWQRHSRLEFGEGGEAYRQQMIQREAELKQRIADEIATRRAAAEAGC